MKYLQIVTLLILFNISNELYSQRILGVASKNSSDISVFITDNPNKADLNVYFVSNQSQSRIANDGIWSYTTFKNSADIRIFYTKTENTADIVIFLVNHRNHAGWLNLQKKKNLNF